MECPRCHESFTPRDMWEPPPWKTCSTCKYADWEPNEYPCTVCTKNMPLEEDDD